MNYNVSDLDGLVIALGNQRETAVTEFSFDASAWGDLSLLLTVQETTGDPYAASGQTQADGTLHWIVGNDVTSIAGDKTIVIRGLSDGVEKRSALFRGLVRPSHAEPGDAPETVTSWISDLALAESERKTSENARGVAETGRDEAEGLRGTAEQGRVSAEQGRISAEQTRAQAEIGRGTAEQGRAAAEDQREENEDVRKTNEQIRVFRENNRLSDELARQDAENGRTIKENARIQNETLRNAAEEGRAAAEQVRAAFYAGFNAALGGKASAGQVMRRVISRTIAAGENVSAIMWTQDDAGHALALKQAEIRVYVPSNGLSVGSTGFIYGRINGLSEYRTTVSDNATAFECAVYRALYGYSVAKLRNTTGSYSIFTDYLYSDGSARSYGNRAAVYPHEITDISSLYLYVVGRNFPAGTTIEVWGVTE